MEQVSLRDYCEEARSLIQSGEPDRAIQITRHILRHYPRHVESYRLLGQALLAAGNYREAIRQFRRVLSAEPEDVASHVGLAGIHEASGDLDKAIWQMRRATELSPSDSDLRMQLDHLINARQGDSTSEQLETTRAALGRIHARGGLYAKAIQEFNAVLTQNPARVDVQAALAEVLWRSGRYGEAAEVCHRMLEKLPNALRANLIIGAQWLDNSQPDEAEPYLRVAQGLDPENIVAQSLFGEESPLPLVTVNIEPLDEDEAERRQLKPSPTLPVDSLPVLPGLEPAGDWKSELHEEEATPMSDQERPDEELELPDWLRGLGDDLMEEKDDQPAASSPPEGEPVESDETPDWLRNLVDRAADSGVSDESPLAEPGDVPDWLRESQPEVPEETPTDSGAPDWLASITAGQALDDLRPESAPIPVESASTPPDSEAHRIDRKAEPEESEAQLVSPDVAGKPASGIEQDRVPSEQILAEEGVDLASAEETIPPGDAEAGPPDWLEDLAEPGPTVEAEVEEATAPSLAERVEPSILEPLAEVAEVSDVPDWLSEIMTGETIPPAEAEPITTAAETAPEVPVDETGLPDWLREFEEPVTEEKESAIQLVPPDVAGEPAIGAEEGQALWEQILAEEGVDLAAAEEAMPPEATGMTAEEWLRSTADVERAPSLPTAPEPPAEEPLVEEPEAPIAEAEAGEAGPLDWLQDIEEPAEEEVQVAPGIEADVREAPERPREAREPVAADAEVEEAGLPDWLRRVSAGEPTPPEEGEPAAPTTKAELPDWLRELKETEPEAEAEVSPDLVTEAVDEKEEAVEVEVDEAGLPDWLREPSAEAAEILEREEGPSDEMPDWLTELEAEEMLLEESAFEELIELETGEMPEWLGEVMAGEPPLSDEWAAESETAALPEAETGEEQIPEWLRTFPEREWKPGAEPTEEAAEPEAPPEAAVQPEQTVQTELPDWLHRLREGVPEPEAPEPPELPVAEAEAEPAEAPVEVEAVPSEEVALEPKLIEPDVEAGPEWLGELVRAEESLVEFEAIEEETVPGEAVAPMPEEPIEVAVAEAPSAVLAEIEPEPISEGEPRVTRELEAIRAEDLPKDPPARLSMARAALNAGDWTEALLIYETLVSSSALLDSVIDHLEVGIRRHPDDPAGHQLLGDACMRSGRFQDALQAYRAALAKL